MEVAMQHFILAFTGPQIAAAPQTLNIASGAAPATSDPAIAATPVLQPAP